MSTRVVERVREIVKTLYNLTHPRCHHKYHPEDKFHVDTIMWIPYIVEYHRFIYSLNRCSFNVRLVCDFFWVSRRYREIIKKRTLSRHYWMWWVNEWIFFYSLKYSCPVKHHVCMKLICNGSLITFTYYDNDYIDLRSQHFIFLLLLLL